MSECEFCFCRDGKSHYSKCPVVNQSSVVQLNGLSTAATLNRGRYKIGMALNHGGFGITYLCKDLEYDRRVVIKEFFPDRFSDRDIRQSNSVRYHGISDDALGMMQEQFYREYDIMTKAAGPGIPAIYDFFPENNSAYIAMDFIDGITFRKYLLKQKVRLPWWELRKKFFMPLMETVSRIHRKGILHRDISLVNLMITKEEKIVLLDFGAGRDFHEQDSAGNLRFANKMYAPIEQTNPEKGYRQGPWTDIFAMGTVFYTAITGEYPPMALERPQKAVESAMTYVPDLPEEVDDVLMKSLFYYPQHRFRSVEEFSQALSAVPDPPRPSIWGRFFRKFKETDIKGRN